MTSYLDGHGTKATPQSEKIPGSKQVQNRAGGFAYELNDFDRLRRFLILGTEGGTYYAGQRELTLENADVVRRCLKEDAAKTIGIVVNISMAGRAPKNDPAIFALAIAASDQDVDTRQLALENLSNVCRIGTHLFQFVEFIEQFRGWGRAVRRAVGAWYDRGARDDLAYQVVKYRQRGGWSHRDLLRLAHPTAKNPEQAAVFAWVAGKMTEADASFAPESIAAFELAQLAEKPSDTAKLVKKFGGKLPREALKTEHLSDPEVWKALIPRMPITATIRNLGTMTKNGALKPMSSETAEVVLKIADAENLIKGRVHPIQVLSALLTYQRGRGVRGDSTWSPIGDVVDALDGAFYKAFGAVDSTGKRIMLALDVSGSMASGEIAGVPGLTPRVGSAAMALVTKAVEPSTLVVGFTSSGGDGFRTYGRNSALTELNISARQRLDDAVREVSRLPFGGTDCALPMLYAFDKGLEVDAFVVYTDNETWAGETHPVQALKAYRAKTGIPAKLVVVGMTADRFSIADPDDAGMLDVVGFDTATPQLISEFISS